jgi:hypothetical protein
MRKSDAVQRVRWREGLRGFILDAPGVDGYRCTGGV